MSWRVDDGALAEDFTVARVKRRMLRQSYVGRIFTRRSGATTADTAELVVGDLVLNLDSHDVSRAEREIQLTATEFDLLSYLMNNARRVVSKSQILDNVWHYDFDGQAKLTRARPPDLRRAVVWRAWGASPAS